MASTAGSVEPAAGIGDNPRDPTAPPALDGALAVLGDAALVALPLQGDGEELTHALLVVHHQHSRFGHVIVLGPGRRWGLPAVAPRLRHYTSTAPPPRPRLPSPP